MKPNHAMERPYEGCQSWSDGLFVFKFSFCFRDFLTWLD
jgi:hypothetical protein